MTGRSAWPVTISLTSPNAISAWTNSPPRQASASSASSAWFARTGLAPHALQLAHRIRLARRLIEAGETIAATAAAAGFADHSHLHRHFQRGLGLTPGEYQRRFRRR